MEYETLFCVSRKGQRDQGCALRFESNEAPMEDRLLAVFLAIDPMLDMIERVASVEEMRDPSMEEKAHADPPIRRSPCKRRWSHRLKSVTAHVGGSKLETRETLGRSQDNKIWRCRNDSWHNRLLPHTYLIQDNKCFSSIFSLLINTRITTTNNLNLNERK